ncbi:MULTISPECIES: permease-like cell division protein FtsX [unclassified Streptomyces]|uniref:permease-like cell division protein FtsX n=1 Tax=unclassified Streptomyces TaxID=2593676 RepID=UPI0004C1F5DF|nr:permease-like cell division protein FtsX [Streptomyces sp. NRRL S-87]
MRAQFVLSEIGVGLRRNLTMTFAVVISVALSLALFGGSLLMRDQVSTMKGYWYDKVNVSIFLCNKNEAETGGSPTCTKGAVTPDQKKQIEADLKKMDLVETVQYESADQAYKHYKEQFGDSPLVTSVTPDQMQESFRVKLKDPEKYKVITTAFAGRDGVQSVQDQRGVLDNLFSLLDILNKAALGVMLVMLVVALLLIVNTVRVSAFSRRRETGIMRLVGASSFYIQMPFIAEAAFAGLIGAFVACGMLVCGQYFVIDHGVSLSKKLELINFIGWDHVVTKLPLVLAIGLLMPAMAAFVALRKYLKV